MKYTSAQVIAIAKAWSHKDDWNVDSIYVGTLRDVVKAGEKVGATVAQVNAHAKHIDSVCEKIACPMRGVA